MVTYLHSDTDARASQDLARIYDTRTLEHVVAVNENNVKRSVLEALKRGATVVVPDDAARYCDGLLMVCRVLKLLRHPVLQVSPYLMQLTNPAPPASAQVHANAEATAARAALPEHSG